MNGGGLRLTYPGGAPYGVIGLGFSPDGERVVAIFAIRNPDKLGVTGPDASGAPPAFRRVAVTSRVRRRRESGPATI